jgi:hypothetical protein
MPKKSKTAWIIVGVVVGTIILCCSATAIYFYPPVFNSLHPDSIANKANNFLMALSQKNFPDAFDLLTFETKDKVETAENLPSYIGFQSELESFSKYRTLGLDFKTKEMTEIWKLHFKDGSVKYLWIVFRDEYHDWKIDRFELHK